MNRSRLRLALLVSATIFCLTMFTGCGASHDKIVPPIVDNLRSDFTKVTAVAGGVEVWVPALDGVRASSTKIKWVPDKDNMLSEVDIQELVSGNAITRTQWKPYAEVTPGSGKLPITKVYVGTPPDDLKLSATRPADIFGWHSRR